MKHLYGVLILTERGLRYILSVQESQQVSDALKRFKNIFIQKEVVALWHHVSNQYVSIAEKYEQPAQLEHRAEVHLTRPR